jgi:hypothetical protein
MGAWGPKSFENDDALEFVAKFEDEPSWALVAATIVYVSELGADYLEAPEAGEAVAAAEIVASKRGKPPAEMPQELARLLAAMTPTPTGLAEASRLAMVRVMDNSELAQLWSEDEERGIGQTSPDWLEAMEDLLRRLA